MLQNGIIWDSGYEIEYGWFKKMKWFSFASKKEIKASCLNIYFFFKILIFYHWVIFILLDNIWYFL